ncbi:MAG TPA: PQQ-binding-like beta-propeller repeat protein [Ktedonobacteraceae bacterium]
MKTSKNSRSLSLLTSMLLLILLTGCGFLSSQPNNSPAITPLALTPTPSTGGAATGTTTTSIPTATAQPGVSNDWTTYHQNTSRTGYVANTPDPTRLSKTWNKQLDGAVYAEPLVIGGRVIVATENNSLYAFASKTGQLLWKTNVGTPVPQSDLPCGDVDPLGITGTPVYDPVTGLVFAVAEISGPAHLLLGLDVTTGKVKVRRVADISGMDPTTHQQRAALALRNGMVYIAYGGLYGDCGDYRGTVVAARTDGTGSLLSFRVPTTREGGIWAASGPAIDSQGNIYVAVGNGEATGGNWDHSDSILRLSPTLKLEDGFAPTSWGDENANDQDLGSMGPILLPGGWIYTDGKAQRGYVLKASNLGGVGGQVAAISICNAFGGAAAIGSQVFVPCTSGLRKITVTAGGQISAGWQAPANIQGSPIAGGNTVYDLDPQAGILYALSSAKGSVRAQVNVGTATRFATPTLVDNMLFIGTSTGIVGVTLS